MAYLKSLPKKSHLSDVFRRFPVGAVSLLKFHDDILREDSPLSVAHRELIAAYVSGLNGCQFCFGAHLRIAALYGITPALFDQLFVDIDSAEVDEAIRPILKYVKKLTLSPSRIVQDDIDLIKAQGLGDDAIYTATLVCGLFNMMNRIVDGTGVSPETIATKSMKGTTHLGKSSYQDFGRMIGVIN